MLSLYDILPDRTASYEIAESVPGPFRSYPMSLTEFRRLQPYRLVARASEVFCAPDYIKEICFSSDGLVIASPHLSGVRLFACTPEAMQSAARGPGSVEAAVMQPCVTLAPDKCNSPVVTTRMAPFQSLLVAGTLAGQVHFYYPRF